MGRGKNIDKHIKEYYDIFDDFESKYDDKLENVYSYTHMVVENYLENDTELVSEIMDVTNCSKNDLVDMILKDAWYHIYENVYFLDVRYNINNDVETIKYNHNIGADSDNESIDVISLKDHLQAKGYDYNKKRRYKERLCKSYEASPYSKRHIITNACPVYADYHSAFCGLNNKYYLCKKYTDIVDFFYAEKQSVSAPRTNMKRYTLWDIDKDWLPEIAELYMAIQNGNRDIFQYQLIERLFKFRLFLYVYNTKMKYKQVDDMLYDIQPFTHLGYSIICADILLHISRFIA